MLFCNFQQKFLLIVQRKMLAGKIDFFFGENMTDAGKLYQVAQFSSIFSYPSLLLDSG